MRPRTSRVSGNARRGSRERKRENARVVSHALCLAGPVSTYAGDVFVDAFVFRVEHAAVPARAAVVGIGRDASAHLTGSERTLTDTRVRLGNAQRVVILVICENIHQATRPRMSDAPENILFENEKAPETARRDAPPKHTQTPCSGPFAPLPLRPVMVLRWIDFVEHSVRVQGCWTAHSSSV